MREKLIELLQSAPADIMGNHGVGALADHLIANGVTIQKWIPVSERLPDIWHNVLAYRKDGSIFIDWIDPHYEWYRGGHSLVTHWMPLPEPPKEE